MSFLSTLRLVQPGDPVKASKVDEPLQQLDANIRYVLALLDAANVGSTVYAREVTVESTVVVGTPVYFNIDNARFEAGLATANIDNVSGVVSVADQAQVWGIVGVKHNATLADVLLFGYDTIDISAATSNNTNTAGVWYLSGVTPGTLVQQRPPVSVPVLRSDGDGKVFVFQSFTDFLDRHTHYAFPLVCEPAGTTAPPAPGERHVITAADSSLPGWLPADDPVFGGLAPSGAIFGYNLGAHAVLNSAWPPLPLSGAVLEWNKGVDKDVGATGVPGSLCLVDRRGIWWLSDCYGDVPWPVDFTPGLSDSASSSSSDSVACPRVLNMALTVYFSKTQFLTDQTVVTSLRSLSPRLRIACTSGNVNGVTGDLTITLNLDLVVTVDAAGSIALKTFDPDTATFHAGPITEGVYAASPNVSLVGTLTGTQPVGGVSKSIFQGLVGVAVSTESTREVSVQLTRLDGVEEEFFEDVLYLGFLPDRDSSVRCKLYIPADLQIANPYLTLRFLLLGRAAGVLPQLTVMARRVSRPEDGLTVPLLLPDDSDEFAVACVTVATLTANNQYVEAVSESFAVEAGEVIFFSIARDASDAYAAEVGLLQQTGRLASGA